MAESAEEAPALVQADLSPEQASAKLDNLKAAATKEYSLKNYAAAANLYSEATELQATINGEMSPQNAELLYAYGRCLYHVAISKSDVLGSKVAGSGEEPKKKKRKTDTVAAEGKVAEPASEPAADKAKGDNEEAANKPFFQITGDENWTDSEGEEDEEADGEAEEEDDDFGVAYEVLDMARVLLTKQIDNLDSNDAFSKETEGKAAATSDITGEKRTVMERLADTHDLQAEIWLESERFSDAVPDFQSALDLKLQIYPAESSIVAEAHYKLSLALEFASIRKVEQEGEAAEADQKPDEVDEEMRLEAASHMDKAIASCRLRVKKENSLLEAAAAEDKPKKQKEIKEVQEMIADLEQRLTDLRNPVALNGSGPAGAPDNDVLGGILGSLLGETAAQQKARIAEVTKGANDLTGLVKKKKAAPQPVPPPQPTVSLLPPPTDSALKRKLADDNAESGITESKKARVEDE
ncbi:hypothetical protein ANO11243_038550 [Dothideomycetidae sp. 11243]|nr:hypothetical protein ANO11243_038550 [fungal sp. No.11243]